MERANLSGKHAAQLLGWSETKVSRLLMGYQQVREADIAALLALCLVKGDEKERLLAIAREYDTPGWLQKYGAGLPEQLQTLASLENRAVEITDFEQVRVPGLLQTGDYAQALLERSATVPPAEIPERVAARLDRQNLFNRDRRPRFTVFLHELALRLPVGGREVMSAQLHNLLQMSVRQYITIRIIPLAAGAHAAMAGACRLMEFEELRPIVYIEEQTAGHFLEERVEIATYRKIFAALANCALTEGQSRDLIADLAVSLYGEDRDGV